MYRRYVLQMQHSLHTIHVLKVFRKILGHKWRIVILPNEKLRGSPSSCLYELENLMSISVLKFSF
jgi:hypothetical protein